MSSSGLLNNNFSLWNGNLFETARPVFFIYIQIFQVHGNYVSKSTPLLCAEPESIFLGCLVVTGLLEEPRLWFRPGARTGCLGIPMSLTIDHNRDSRAIIAGLA
jgi:hypothetical protein